VIRNGFNGSAVAQTNAPLFVPQPLLLELTLPVVDVQRLSEEGAAVKLRPVMALLGAKPRSTEPM